MSKRGFGQMYRQPSGKLLDLVVTPHVLGEVPVKDAQNADSDATRTKDNLLCLAKSLTQQCFGGRWRNTSLKNSRLRLTHW